MTDNENPFYCFWNTTMEGNSFVSWQKWYSHPKCRICDCARQTNPTWSAGMVGRPPRRWLRWVVQISKFLISSTRECDLNTSCLIKSSDAGCSCRSGWQKLFNTSPWHSALQSLTPLLCLLRFQGRGPTCPSCWAADWPAAALHEGWVKSQEGPHDPAQPGNHLFQKSSLFGDCSHLLRLRPPTTPTASFNKAARHQLKSALLVRSDVLFICTAERPSHILIYFLRVSCYLLCYIYFY